MNDRQKEYFRLKLLAWQDEILKESKLTLQALQQEKRNGPDLADLAASEPERAIEHRAQAGQIKLLAKSDAALQHILDHTYGDCEDNGAQISWERLAPQPVVTL